MRRIIVLSSLLIANVCFGAPVIVVEPTELNFSAFEGGSDPNAQMLYISNEGKGKLEWEMTETCDWLSVDLLSGTLLPNEIAEITISIDIEGLKAVFYYAEITISSINGDIPEIVDVFLFVGAAPLMAQKRFYAHSKTGRPRKEWQDLNEHLCQVAENASRYAAKFQSGDWGWNAGWLHDIGKKDKGK